MRWKRYFCNIITKDPELQKVLAVACGKAELFKILSYWIFFTCLSAAKQIDKNSIDMAKVQIKSEKLTPFGGIFPFMEHFVPIRFMGWGEGLDILYSIPMPYN